jgi:hypothetical protein
MALHMNQDAVRLAEKEKELEEIKKKFEEANTELEIKTRELEKKESLLNAQDLEAHSLHARNEAAEKSEASVHRDLQSMVHSLTRWLKRCFILFMTDCKAWALIEGEDLPSTVRKDFFMLSAMFG